MYRDETSSVTNTELEGSLPMVRSSRNGSRNHGAVTRSRCGDGVSVVMTVPHRVELI